MRLLGITLSILDTELENPSYKQLELELAEVCELLQVWEFIL
jgi:hypothetical protein